MGCRLKGERIEIPYGSEMYPKALTFVRNPPKRLYVIGDPLAMSEGLAVVGARKATPYGLGCAYRFARMAAKRKVCIISGGARGCDSQAHIAALEHGGKTVVFHGPGMDNVYPYQNRGLFQRVIDAGGAIVSERTWSDPVMPWMFRERNRLIAGLAKATLIVEAGLPSGTFSTADDAIAANREVLVVPGAITSEHSRGANTLIYQGAIPVVDDEVFAEQLDALFGAFDGSLLPESGGPRQMPCESEAERRAFERLFDALQAQQMSLEAMRSMIVNAVGEERALQRLMVWVAFEQGNGTISRYPDGRYGSSGRA